MRYTKKNEESVRGGLDRHRLPAVGVVAIFFLELATLNWSSEIY
jgi:hypothetical protein